MQLGKAASSVVLFICLAFQISCGDAKNLAETDVNASILVDGDSWTHAEIWDFPIWTAYEGFETRGRGGNVIQNFPNKLGSISTRLCDFTPDLANFSVLIVIGGVNDVSLGEREEGVFPNGDLGNIIDGATDIMRCAAEAEVKLVLSTAQPFGRFTGVKGINPWESSTEAVRVNYNKWLKTQQSDTVDIVDVDPVIGQFDPDLGTDGGWIIRPEFDLGDGIHLNQVGNFKLHEHLRENGVFTIIE